MKTDTKPTKISPMPAVRPSAIVGLRKAQRCCKSRNWPRSGKPIRQFDVAVVAE